MKLLSIRVGGLA